MSDDSDVIVDGDVSDDGDDVSGIKLYFQA